MTLGIGRVRLVLAQIVIDTRASQGRATEPKAERVFGGNDGHALSPRHPNSIFLQEDDVFIDLRREVLKELTELVNQRRRQIPLHAADSIPAGRETRAAQFIEPVQQNLTIAKGIEKDGHRTDIERLRS